MFYVLYAILGAVVGAGVVALVTSMRNRRRVGDASDEAERIVREARAQSETIKRQAELDAHELKLTVKGDFEKEAKTERAEIQRLQERLAKKEESSERKAELITTREQEVIRKEKDLIRREKNLSSKEEEADRLVDEAQKELSRVAGLTADEARAELREKIVDDARHSAAVEAKQIEDQAREEAEKKSKKYIAVAIQRFAGEYVQERAVTAVELPSDDMKGRIIGREGRNIRALEAACGVDLVIDDTPETVVISGFDPVRREVARIALERLIADGRIHPTRIEEVVGKAREEVDRSIREAGDQAVLELGLSRIHGDLVKLLGSLRYRYSYAQNVLRHSVETGFIAGLLAAELKMNVKQARRAGLLHDIGKAVSHEQEGSHAVVGAQIAKKYGEVPIIVNAIGSHHEDEEPDSVLAHLVAAADALSGARPGARREMLETYVRRLEDLERICRSFAGVEKSYAVQAGREVRVMVESEKISDADARFLCRDIAKKVEDELTYPGQIRVTVIRETRAIEYAR
jgi:ribonuclease Y